MYKLSIDIGGTNSDVVLIKSTQKKPTDLIEKTKTLTSRNVTESVMSAIDKILRQHQEKGFELDKSQTNIYLGTTHFVNALRQKKDLEKVAIVRFALPTSDVLPPFSTWPDDEGGLLPFIFGYSAILHGYCEHNDEVNFKISQTELKGIAEKIKQLNIKQVVLSSPFSSTHSEMENIAKAELQKYLSDDVNISLASAFHYGGILQRENAAALNAALIPTAIKVFNDITQKLKEMGFTLPIFVTKSDGAFMSCEEAMQFPLFAYSSGPINSIRGITLSTDVKKAITIDIGGTTSDIGLIVNRAPYMTNLNVDEEGVDFNIQCAHQKSIALGGGTIITKTPEGNVVLTEHSLQSHILSHTPSKRPLYVDGETFTLTDLGLILNRLSIEGVDNLVLKKYAERKGWTEGDIEQADNLMHERLARGVDNIRTNNENLPVILGGGGAPLINEAKLKSNVLISISRIARPLNYEVINAIGASSPIIRITKSDQYSKSETTKRETLLEKAAAEAVQRGADKTTFTLVNEHTQELSYSTTGEIRLTIVCEASLKPATINSTYIPKNHSAFLTLEQIDTKKYIQDEPYESSFTTYNPYSVKCRTLEHQAEKDDNIHILNQEDIKHLALGASYLGSGGGGDTEECKHAANHLTRQGDELKMIKDIDKLNDEDYVFFAGLAGMPEILKEKLNTTQFASIILDRIKASLQRKFGGNINLAGIIPVEIGGSNGILTAAMFSSIGVPFIDADVMGRAFPTLIMSSIHPNSGIKEYVGVCVNESCLDNPHEMKNNDLIEWEKDLFGFISTHGGSVLLGCMPMTVAEAKTKIIKNTFSSAISIGREVCRALQQKAPIVSSLNEILSTTIYRECNTITNGVITQLIRRSNGEHNFGEIIISNDQHDCKIYYENENLLAFIDNKPVCLTPDLITLINPDTGLPIGSSSDYHVGLRVTAVKIGAPSFYLDASNEVSEDYTPVFRGDAIEEIIHSMTSSVEFSIM